MKLNLPNKITISRIVLIPLVIFFYLASFIPYNIGKFVALFVFMLAAYTDHLDGYFARKNNQVTNQPLFLSYLHIFDFLYMNIHVQIHLFYSQYTSS